MREPFAEVKIRPLRCVRRSVFCLFAPWMHSFLCVCDLIPVNVILCRHIVAYPHFMDGQRSYSEWLKSIEEFIFM